MALEATGYIVVTSVSSPESVSAIESKSHGFIRALVLDPNEVRQSLVVSTTLLNSPLAWYHPSLSPVTSLHPVTTVPHFNCRRSLCSQSISSTHSICCIIINHARIFCALCPCSTRTNLPAWRIPSASPFDTRYASSNASSPSPTPPRRRSTYTFSQVHRRMSASCGCTRGLAV